MKISKIHIHNYFQFQNFELDLTYPKGHEKEGQPLDKICFIGESGTGKTTLLNVINEVGMDGLAEGRFFKMLGLKPIQSFSVILRGENSDGEKENDTVTFSGSGLPLVKPLRKLHVKALLYFPAGLSSIFFSEQNKQDYVSKYALKYGDRSENYSVKNYLFSKELLEELWIIISYTEIKKYQDAEATYRIQMSKKIEEGISNTELQEGLKKWKSENPNPLEKIAEECLDKILNKFFLAVKTEIDDIRAINTLQICSSTTGKVIPYEKLSSGTRQIIYTAFPIYQLLEEGSIVLMDEPENSLYPDVQKEIIPYYTSFDAEKKSQFFFATHSPIIASAFEPWEIVELKFNEEGNIYRELYYDTAKENHVHNYHTDARYLRWDSILTKVFDLKEEGNTVFRSRMLMEFAILEKKITELEKAGKLKDQSREVQDVVTEYKRVGELLDWETGNS